MSKIMMFLTTIIICFLIVALSFFWEMQDHAEMGKLTMGDLVKESKDLEELSAVLFVFGIVWGWLKWFLFGIFAGWCIKDYWVIKNE